MDLESEGLCLNLGCPTTYHLWPYTSLIRLHKKKILTPTWEDFLDWYEE